MYRTVKLKSSCAVRSLAGNFPAFFSPQDLAGDVKTACFGSKRRILNVGEGVPLSGAGSGRGLSHPTHRQPPGHHMTHWRVVRALHDPLVSSGHRITPPSRHQCKGGALRCARPFALWCPMAAPGHCMTHWRVVRVVHDPLVSSGRCMAVSGGLGVLIASD